MKKVLLITLSFFLTTFQLLAQNNFSNNFLLTNNSTKLKSISAYRNLNTERSFPIEKNSSRNYFSNGRQNRIAQVFSELTIGNTQYDIQTFASIANRLLVHNDSTISAVWMMIVPGMALNSRGTGYNYFDGNNWGPIPSTTINLFKDASPSIVVSASNKEMCFTQGSINLNWGIANTYRPQKGNGTWSANYNILSTQTDLWPRAFAGGSNSQTVHILNSTSLYSHGQLGPLFYSRSTDEGQTFSISHHIIPAIDSSHYRGFFGDNYSIDTKGDTVAIVVGNYTTDLILLKSIDNGSNWTSKVIRSFPIPFYNDSVDSIIGTLEGPSGDAHVMIDYTGLVHVFWSNALLGDTTAASPLFIYPNATDALLYWNENHPLGVFDTIAKAQDKNGDGILNLPLLGQGGGNGMGNYRGGITQMPSSAVDKFNNLFVAYQSYCENCDTSAFNTGHKHVYTIMSPDSGLTWSNPLDVDQTPDSLNQENVYACLAKNANGYIHLICQRDGAPGNSLSSNATEAGWNSATSDIIYTKINYSIPGSFPWTFRTGTFSVPETNRENLELNLYPNPTENLGTISFSIKNASTVKLELRDILGNLLYSENKGYLASGKHSIQLSTSQFPNGIYFYTLKANLQEASGKMVVSHF